MSIHALTRMGLDYVWWLVAPHNPLKSKREMAAYDRRLESAAKVSKHPRILASDIEIQMGTQYTADTLAALCLHFPTTHFVWMMGSDNLLQVHRWHHWQSIFRQVPVCVFDRPPQGSSLRACPARLMFGKNIVPERMATELPFMKPPALTILHVPLNAQSSTAIRKLGQWRV